MLVTGGNGAFVRDSFAAPVSIPGSRVIYVGLSQNKLQCVHGNEGTRLPGQQCGSLMCF